MLYEYLGKMEINEIVKLILCTAEHRETWIISGIIKKVEYSDFISSKF